MSHTRASTLILFAVIGLVGGWFLDAGLAASGQPTVMPSYALPVVLVAIGVIVVIAAVPVRRAVRARRHGNVNPFYATRVVVLAKACALTGALLAGAGLGLVAYILGRGVVAGVGSVLMAAAMAVGSVLLLVAGLIAERMCTIPPDDDENDRGPTATA